VTDRFVVGLDVGTSGARAVLYAFDGTLVASALTSYPLETPHPGWAEQDPERIWRAVVGSLGELAKRVPTGGTIAAIGVATIFHTLLAVDAGGNPVTNSIIWADLRSRRQVAALRTMLDPSVTYQHTGCPLHPMYLPGKILWLRENQPERFARVATFGSIKDFLLARLTGRRIVDRSVASASGLWDLLANDWYRPLLDAVSVRFDQLPGVVEPTDVVAGLAPEVAAQCGLPAGLPVVAGAGDGVLSSLGAGSVSPGQMTVMIGTSGATRLATARPVLDPRERTWCYYLALGRWITGAAINNGGLALQWVRENLIPGPGSVTGEWDFETLVADAEQSPPGSRGLVFLPFLAGERSPFWNASARGVIFGLATHMGPPDVARSVFEGVCYRMRSIVEALDDVAGPSTELRAAGGFARSPFWLQLLTDILGRPMSIPDAPQASAFGAAGLAMIAVGVLSSLEDVARLVEAAPGPVPNSALHPLYSRIYDIYLELYWANQASFTKVAALQEDLDT
jgi:gluconokinase